MGPMKPHLKYPKHFRVTSFLLFIFILGGALAVAYTFYQDALSDARNNNEIKARLLSRIILEHERAVSGIVQSYASRPLVIAAVKKRDLQESLYHLTRIKQDNIELDIVFITDPHGLLWVNFPTYKEIHGKNFSARDWYQGVSKEWKPYVSAVFQRTGGDKDFAVAVCAPIFDETGKVIGILGTSQRVDVFERIVQEIVLNPGEKITLIDQQGGIIYRTGFPSSIKRTGYPIPPWIKNVAGKEAGTFEVEDPSDGNQTKYVAFSPIKRIGWAVMVETGKKEALESHATIFIQIGVISALLFFLVILSRIYSRKEYHYLKELDTLSSRLLTSQEEERKRIAGEIHDSLSSSLSAIKYVVEDNITQLEKGITNPESLRALIPMLQQSIGETRRIMTGLRPAVLDDLGLLAAMTWFCREFQIIHPGIRVEKDWNIDEKLIPKTLRIIIFRIIQEAFHNITKHSRADSVKLFLQKTNSAITLTVQDNGQGFDPKRVSKGLGLDSMEERARLSAGTLVVESAKEAGTVIRASWPIDKLAWDLP